MQTINFWLMLRHLKGRAVKYLIYIWKRKEIDQKKGNQLPYISVSVLFNKRRKIKISVTLLTSIS
jgi:hypothetical protein